MLNTFDRLFLKSQYENQAEQAQDRMAVIITLVMLILFLVYDLQTAARGSLTVVQQALNGDPFPIVYVLGAYVGGILTLIGVRLGQPISRYGPLVMWVSGGILLSVRDGIGGTAADSATLIALVIIGFITLRERGILIGTVAALALLIVGLDRRSILPGMTGRNSVDDFFDISLLIVGSSLALWLYLRNQVIERQETRAEAESGRLRLATITTEIARRISTQMTLDELLTSTVEEIRDRYADIYHAQIFLIDEFGSMAKLVASTGEVGKLLLSRSHQLEVGSLSVIGQVTFGGEAIVARAGSEESIHRRNELLPETVVEAAFPLVVSGKTIGALDLQSRDVEAFTKEDIPIFQSLADSIGVAIENARLFQQTESRLRENQRLLDQMSSAMREIERLNRELTGQSWSEYMGTYMTTSSLDVNFKTNTVERSGDWTPALRQAVTADQPVQERRGDASVIAVPIRVRGQVIGAMEFELDASEGLDESVGLAQTVGERFGLALENTRLYEETQRAATREQRVNAIAAQYQSVTTVDELLRITVSELGDLLGAEKASIRLGGISMAGADSPPRSNGNGSHAAENGGNG